MSRKTLTEMVETLESFKEAAMQEHKDGEIGASRPLPPISNQHFLTAMATIEMAKSYLTISNYYRMRGQ